MISLNPLSRYSLNLISIIAAFFVCVNAAGCGKGSGGPNKMPSGFLWAWERPEDLRFVNADNFGVAFLAQTIYLDGDRISTSLRKQPLKVPENVYLIAVTRIETKKRPGGRSYTESQKEKVVRLIEKTLELPDVSAVQIDFDAVASERSLYRELITAVRTKLPENIGLTITALASWCIDDRWMSGLPIDEAIPMLFQMGPDRQKVLSLLKNEIDFDEPLCRNSYGLEINEAIDIQFKSGRRFFYFNPEAWESTDLPTLEK